MTEPACTRCDGRGWIGAAKGSQFAYIERLAWAGRLPTKPCPECSTPPPRAPDEGAE